MQETGQVVRRVRQQLAAADADKNVEELELDIFELEAVGCIREFRVQKTQRTRVGTQAGNAFDEAFAGRTKKQRGEEHIFGRTRGVDLIGFIHGKIFIIKIRAQPPP